jgi:predicted metal-dependent peptidase
MYRPVPRVAVVIDTSASVTDEQLGLAWAEVLGCMRSIGIRRDLLRVYAVDVDAHRIDIRQLGAVALVGGGGTDMRRGIQAALESAPRPDVIVVITDGLTRWPSRRPPGRIVIALLGSPIEPPALPEWATVVRIPDQREAVARRRAPLA